MKPHHLIACLSLGIATLPAIAFPAEAPVTAAAGQTVTIPVKMQAWQARRAAFARIVNDLQNTEKPDYTAFKSVLDEFEQKPFTRTPMENMEILGLYYVPAQGIEATLTHIAANAALGWYDALRYGTESGRSEIMHNEGFFKLPFVLGGETYTKQAIKFFEEQPDKTAKLVQAGIALAESLKDDPRYDHAWPSAYGLERTLCAMGADCPPPSVADKARWATAWDETKARVVRYYRINKPIEEAPESKPKKAQKKPASSSKTGAK
jgi:hypothetical protein